MKISFSKYQGTGNDFILIDDREDKIHLSKNQIKNLCDRHTGIGADGFILFRNKSGFDFEMVYYNSDGGESSMCGNGGRCITGFAKTLIGINGEANFSAVDGAHRAIITNETPLVVKLKMGNVTSIENNSDDVYLDTGSPHYVIFKDDVASIDVLTEGRKIRYNNRFKEKGTNVNFVEIKNGELFIRTYERGVEDETLSCGTGVTASVIAAVSKNKIGAGENKVSVITPGGKLNVYFERNGNAFENVWLEGGATFVFNGEIEV